MSSPSVNVMWFRRDLRLGDNPALCAAASSADQVAALFVLDPALLAAAGVRAARLKSSLAALNADTGGALIVRTGDPRTVVPEFADSIGAREVHISGESTPYGRRRDEHVENALRSNGCDLVTTGSPYAVSPGRVLNGQGSPYRVFTPFSKMWRDHGWRAAPQRPDVSWFGGASGEQIADSDDPSAGESAALAQWAEFSERIAPYDEDRDRPDRTGTSGLSTALKYGEIHPRTLLGDLAKLRKSSNAESVDRFVTELAWREFYADVLYNSPASAWSDWSESLRGMRYDDDEDDIEAWSTGHTGYPFVDAGMRQLLATGWMHNRLRMVTASFLIKDLHVWWPVGARHFLEHLTDGDIASNNHGWQWVAGTGTDAAPYFRVFNPVLQGERFDPDGEYVRRWIPELQHISGRAVHQPWKHPQGYQGGYPERIVDHAQERREALARLGELRD